MLLLLKERLRAPSLPLLVLQLPSGAQMEKRAKGERGRRKKEMIKDETREEKREIRLDYCPFWR